MTDIELARNVLKARSQTLRLYADALDHPEITGNQVGGIAGLLEHEIVFLRIHEEALKLYE